MNWNIYDLRLSIFDLRTQGFGPVVALNAAIRLTGNGNQEVEINNRQS
jgi:hypothetical protein